MKKALVLRWGAFGDLVIASPVFSMLKRDGYHVTANISESGEPIVRHNPNIDKIVTYKTDSVPADQLDAYWAELATGYDKFINLTGSLEHGLLASEKGDADYHLSHEERHAKFNHNYYDRTMEIAGYPVKGLTGELYFTPAELQWARDFRKKYKGQFLIVWGLSGSSFHKTYPWAEYAANTVLNRYDNIRVVTVGDSLCQLIGMDHRHVKNLGGYLPIRKSMLLTKIADLVISTETGLLNAAGCFDTPKIALLSHSSVENLTKHFRNCVSLHADVDCYPCHRLIYTRNACKLDRLTQAPVCMGALSMDDVAASIENFYQEWRRNGDVHRSRGQEVFCR